MAGGGANVGSAYITIIPSMRGSRGTIEKELAGVDGASAGAKIGNSLGTGLLSNIKGHIGGIATALAGIGLAKFAKDSVSAFTQLAGNTIQLQRIAGGTAMEISSMAGAMRLSGMDTSKANMSLTIFSKKLQAVASDAKKTAQMEDLLGFSIRNADGSMKSMGQLLPQVAEKFKNMPDGIQKTALATQLFGRSGTAMLPFLNKGAQGIQELMTKAQQLGIVMDDTAIQKFKEFKGASREFQAGLEGAKIQLGGALLPALTAVNQTMNTLFVPAIKAGITVLTDFIGGIATGIDGSGFRDAVMEIGNAVTSAFNDGSNNKVKNFGEAIGRAINGAIPILRALSPILGTTARFIKLVGDNAEFAVPLIAGFFIAVKSGSFISSVTKGIGSFSESIRQIKGVEKVGSAVAGIGGKISSASTSALSGAKNFALAGVAIAGIGGGVMMASIGIQNLVNASRELADAGAGAQITFGIIALGIVGLGVAGALAGEALSAGAVGLLAFGGAVLLIGLGIGVASLGVGFLCQGFAVLAGQLPIVAQFGLQGAISIFAMGSAMFYLGAGTVIAGVGVAVLGVGMLALGAGALIAGAGVAVLGAGCLVLGVALTLCATGLLMAGAGALMCGAGFSMCAPFVMMMATSLPLIGVAGLGASGALMALAGAGFACMAGCGAGAIAIAGLAGASGEAMNNLGSMNSGMWEAGEASNSLNGAFSFLQGTISSVANMFAQIGNNASLGMSVAVNAVQNGMNAIQSACSREIWINNFRVGALPHFRLEGDFNAETKSVPRIEVDWYAKGGIFNKPAIIGVGEGRSSEAVIPLNNDSYSKLADGIDSNFARDTQTIASVEMFSIMTTLLSKVEKIEQKMMSERDFSRAFNRGIGV